MRKIMGGAASWVVRGGFIEAVSVSLTREQKITQCIRGILECYQKEHAWGGTRLAEVGAFLKREAISFDDLIRFIISLPGGIKENKALHAAFTIELSAEFKYYFTSDAEITSALKNVNAACKAAIEINKENLNPAAIYAVASGFESRRKRILEKYGLAEISKRLIASPT